MSTAHARLVKMIACAAIWVSARFAVAAAYEEPTALRAFEQARTGIVSGRVEWVVSEPGHKGSERRWISRYARNGDVILENRGNRDGWTVVTEARGGVLKYPHVYMRNDDGWWRHLETTLYADWWKQTDAKKVPPRIFTDRLLDVRNAGIHVGEMCMWLDVGFRDVWEGSEGSMYKPLSWSQERNGSGYIVSARYQSGAVATWEINPDKGWNAERITFDAGPLHQETVCTLKQFGGVWFPERTESYVNGRLERVIQITSAQFNGNDDPQRFTPGDMGLEAGTNITAHGQPTELGKWLVWNGEDICSSERWFQDVQSGARRPGPTFRRLSNGERFLSPYDTEEDRHRRELFWKKFGVESVLNRHKGLWEKYVRDFIARFALTDEQQELAWKILRSCQEAAERSTRHERTRCMPLMTEQQTAEELDPKKSKQLEELLAQISEKVEGIFTEQLKPRLEKLPTRAQRRAAEAKQSASQPVSKP